MQNAEGKSADHRLFQTFCLLPSPCLCLTLAERQRTWRLMAWTRTSRWFVALVALVLVTATAILTLQRFQRGQPTPKDIQGDWEGTLSIDKVRLRLVFHFAKAADG